MTQLPEFHSFDLRAAVEISRAAIEGRDDARNRVSADIKSLESYLLRVGLKETIRHPMGMVFEPPDGQEQYVSALLDISGSASGHIIEEALVWGPDSAGKVRLLHEVSRWQGSVEIDVPGGPYFKDESTLERESKPLIERPFEIRKKVYDQLPSFVRALGQHLRIEHVDDLPAVADLPF